MKKLGFGYLYLLNTLLLWSTYEVVSKTLVGKINPFQINFIRFLVGGVFLFAFLAFKNDLKISKRDLIQAAFAGVLNVVLSMNLVQLSLYFEGAKASIVAVIFSSNPIFVTVFAAIGGEEKIRPHKIAGLLLGVMGILVIFLEKNDLRLSNFQSPLLALLAAACFGLYTVVARKTTLRIGSLKMNSYSFIMGSLALLPMLIWSGVNPFEFDPSEALKMGYLSILLTGLAYLTYFLGLSRTSASTGSLIFFGKPILASIFAVLALGESFTINLLIGTFLIILGILFVLYWETIANRLRA